MGQKVNPISVRLEQSNRHFDSCWYSDYQYSNLLIQDLKVKSYINNILKQMRCPESHISMIYMAKKIKILFCYLDPRHSTYKKSSRFYLKLVTNKNNKIKKKRRKQNFLKNQSVGRYLCRKIKKMVSKAKKMASIENNRSISFMKKKTGDRSKQSEAATGNFRNQNSVYHHIGWGMKIDSQKRNNNPLPKSKYSLGENGGKLGLTKKVLMPVTNNKGAAIPYYKKNIVKPDRILDRPVSSRNKSLNGTNRICNKETTGVPLLVGQTTMTRSGDGSREASEASQAKLLSRSERSEQNNKYKKKVLRLNDAVLPSQPVPYSPLVTRKNPFRILLAFYRKKKKRNKKYSTKKRIFTSRSVVSRTGWKSGKGGVAKRTKRLLERKVAWRQTAFWKYLTNVSVSSMGGKKKKNYDVFSTIWGYLFFNHQGFFNKVIQRRKGFQIWQKSLFIRYLLLFIYKKRMTSMASPLNYFMDSHIFPRDMQPVNQINPSLFAGKSYVSSNLKKTKKKNTKNLYIQGNTPFLFPKRQRLKKINFNVDADRIRLANKNTNSSLLKYHVALESINRIEWFQGRGLVFLWLLFNSVHPTFLAKRDQNVFNTELVTPKNGRNSIYPQSRQGFHFLLDGSQKTKDNLNLYTYPYRMTQNQSIVVNNLENALLSNSKKIEGGEKRTDTFPPSMLTRNANSFNLSATIARFVNQDTPSIKKKSRGKKMQIPCPLAKQDKHHSLGLVSKKPYRYASLQRKQTVSFVKEKKKNGAKRKTFNQPSLLLKKEKRKLRFNRKRRHKYLESKKRKKTVPIPRKPFYPRRVKSKGFLCYMEYVLSSQLKSNVRLFSWKTRDEKKSALFIVEQIVYFLQKRVPFSRIKQQMDRELKLKSMQGIRITYSGRLGGRSKKAQRSRRKTFQWGQTSSHVFASRLSFAFKNALTIFGKAGIKVWVCYR